MTAHPPLLDSYRRHLDHIETCRPCRTGNRCPVGRTLEHAWKTERRQRY